MVEAVVASLPSQPELSAKVVSVTGPVAGLAPTG